MRSIGVTALIYQKRPDFMAFLEGQATYVSNILRRFHAALRGPARWRQGFFGPRPSLCGMRFYAPLYLPRPSTRVALKSSNSPMRILHLMRIDNDVVEAIGNTSLIKLKHASNATGCTVLGKAEFMNPGQSVKDRAGKQMILEAERRGDLKPAASWSRARPGIPALVLPSSRARAGIAR